MYCIAEIGQAHEGSLGILHSYIDALKETGVHAIKFQTHIAQAESSHLEPFRVKFSYEDNTRFDYWKRMEFTPEQWDGIKSHCKEVELDFISSPFSITAVDLLESIGIQKYKIGSGEVTNLLMLERIAKTGKEVILSSGMSNWFELDQAVDLLNRHGVKYSILQCTTAYPTTAENWGLNVISELKNRYKVPIGFSDHSGDIFACLAAASMGAEILEFHAVFDKRMFGPDTKASLTVDQISQLCKGVGLIGTALNNPIIKNDNEKFIPLKAMFEKTLSVNCDLSKGVQLDLKYLEAKKPANAGIPASDYLNVIGKTLVKDIKAWDFLTIDDIQ
ncbi:MAG: N-acetylneuraminate synthase [Bacteroidetes bacterium B1(2017)]|nr:MAG: N-acetylneuraminate synthase [Bacteroidetes bacterium B1(2017)]